MFKIVNFVVDTVPALHHCEDEVAEVVMAVVQRPVGHRPVVL